MTQACPVCKGVGLVGHNFYDLNPNRVTFNELPNRIPCRACNGVGIITDSPSALQSKEEEVNRLKNDLLDALDLKEGNGPTALSMLKSANDSLQEQLKAKDEQIKGLINRRVGHTVLDGLYEEQKSTIDSLTSENEQLKKDLRQAEDILEPQIKGAIAWQTEAEGLEDEVARLKELVEKCKPLAFHATLDPKQNWNNQATELLKEIDSLISQSTDKP